MLFAIGLLPVTAVAWVIDARVTGNVIAYLGQLNAAGERQEQGENICAANHRNAGTVRQA